MNVVVIGTGYVGLVAGGCFAEIGHRVTCVDISPQKINNLKNGILPIYEPGLEDIVRRNHAAGRLNFTTRLHEAMDDAHIYCIAVGTPPDEDGSADLSHVLAVAKQIGDNLEHPAIIINKSTVPVGTAEKVRAVISDALAAREKNIAYDVVSNPEFLNEGVAIQDFMHPDRIIIGADNDAAYAQMRALYAPLIEAGAQLIAMNVRDAEMTKDAANAMLATRISFMNEIAGICEHLGVDVENVRLGIGSDRRIGHRFIHPGPGYGGSCFPKDVRALVSMAKEAGYEPHVLHAVETRNHHQKNSLYQKLRASFGGDLCGKTIAIWGLAFKPGTDDMREAPSIDLIEALLEDGAKVRAYDPVAQETARAALPHLAQQRGELAFSEDAYSAAAGADALVLVTEWPEFREPDFAQLRRKMRHLLIIDGRNQYHPETLSRLGFHYIGVGRGQKNAPVATAIAS